MTHLFLALATLLASLNYAFGAWVDREIDTKNAATLNISETDQSTGAKWTQFQSTISGTSDFLKMNGTTEQLAGSACSLSLTFNPQKGLGEIQLHAHSRLVESLFFPERFKQLFESNQHFTNTKPQSDQWTYSYTDRNTEIQVLVEATTHQGESFQVSDESPEKIVHSQVVQKIVELYLVTRTRSAGERQWRQSRSLIRIENAKLEKPGDSSYLTSFMIGRASELNGDWEYNLVAGCGPN